MKRFCLNFICKNEAHIIQRMLTSALPITDLIVAVDTGSTDDTVRIIEQFGCDHHLPTFVFDRPFDNFCNARNAALDRLREVVQGLGWPPEDTYGFWFDCDELFCLAPAFDRSSITLDLYYVRCRAEENTFTKQLFFSLARAFYWVGPVHEFMTTKEPPASNDIVDHVEIIYEKEGHSWKGNLEAKFLRYVSLLKDFIAAGHTDFRWQFYVGESYTAAAVHGEDADRRLALLEKAREEYQKLEGGSWENRDDRFKLYHRLANNLALSNKPWEVMLPAYLRAYAADKRHGEPHGRIIEHYLSVEEWHTAYLYSSFAVTHYHLEKPLAHDISEIEGSLYDWRLLFYHYYACMRTGRLQEGQQCYRDLTAAIERPGVRLTLQERRQIEANTPWVIQWKEALEHWRVTWRRWWRLSDRPAPALSPR